MGSRRFTNGNDPLPMTSLNLFEVTYRLKAVDEQTSDLLSTTRHVYSNLNEARRLRRLSVVLIDTAELAWIDGVINDTELALQAVAQIIEPARIDRITKNKVSFGSRVIWAFRDSPKVRDKHTQLMICHQTLVAVISSLQSKPSAIVAASPEECNKQKAPRYDSGIEELLSWQSRRRQRKSVASHGEKKADELRLNDMCWTNPGLDSIEYNDSLTSSSKSEAEIGRRPIVTGEPQNVQHLSQLADSETDITERPTSAPSVEPSAGTASPISYYVKLYGTGRMESGFEDPEPPYTKAISSLSEKLSDVSMDTTMSTLKYQQHVGTSSIISLSESQAQHLDLTNKPVDHISHTGLYPATSPVYESLSFAKADVSSVPMVAEIDSDPSGIIQQAYFTHDSGSHLNHQQIYIPYRPANESLRPPNLAFGSNNSTPSPSLFSMEAPPQTFSSRESAPACRPPLSTADQTHNRKASGLESSLAGAGDTVQSHSVDQEQYGTRGRPEASQTASSGDSAPVNIRKGGRSWLMAQARHSDVRHYMGTIG